jgi:4,4'-diaponeurosporenoate glycosyltransferase
MTYSFFFVSSRNNKRVARSYGATVVDVVDDTEGKWYGKSHACYQGVTHFSPCN